MSKIMQNLVLLMDSSGDGYDPSLKGGNMIFNRFCIDEDAAFELSGISYLKQPSRVRIGRRLSKAERKVKGKDDSMNSIHSYGLRPSYFILKNIIRDLF